MKKVQGHKYLYRDDSGAIVNTDSGAYQAYIAKRERSKKRDSEVDSLKKDLDDSKKQIEELKELLQQVLNSKP